MGLAQDHLDQSVCLQRPKQPVTVIGEGVMVGFCGDWNIWQRLPAP